MQICAAFESLPLVWLPNKSTLARPDEDSDQQLDRDTDQKGHFYHASGPELHFDDATATIESHAAAAVDLRALAPFYKGETLRRFFSEQLRCWTSPTADPSFEAPEDG